MAKQTIDTNHPVAIAVLPLIEDAAKSANEQANKIVAYAAKELEAAGWDIEKAAPTPRCNMGDAEYREKNARRSLFSMLTTSIHEYGRAPVGQPNIVKMVEARIAKFIENAEDDARAQYEAFVGKLVKKIGACDTATLAGNHVWGYSVLTVRKGAEVEFWKTQTIVNRSKLGTPFYQFPTRKVKGA